MLETAATVLVLLHAPGGRQIHVNPDLVVSMRTAVEGEPNVALTDEVKCMLNTNDGKFISVVERCDMVMELFNARRK